MTGYGPGWIAINGERVSSSFVISTLGDRFSWGGSAFEELKASHFERLAELDVELVIFGSGQRIRFPAPEMVQALYSKRIGLETMDTQAACRTYNFLAGEGRKVAAALLL